MIQNTAYCTLDKHYKKKFDKYNVKLCIYINRKRHYRETPHNLTKDEWEKIKTPNLKDKSLKAVKNAIQEIETKARNVLKNLPNPTIDSFLYYYNSDDPKSGTDPLISDWFDNYSNELKSKERPNSYVEHILTSKKSFENFKKGTRFSDINKDFIEKYERWMLSNNKSYATIQSYKRDLRTVYNYVAKTKRIISNLNNPFGQEITIGKTIGRKKVLSKEEMIKLLEHPLPLGGELDFARDIFVFQYLVNGLNILDLCKLKEKNFYSNANGLFIKFFRTKSSRTKIEKVPIIAFVHPVAKEIIDKWGNKNRQPEDFIFGFFNPLKGKPYNPKMERALSQKTDSWLNRRLKKLTKKLELSIDLTSGVARSTFATILKRQNLDVKIISDSMGHSSISITEVYLKSTDDNVIKDSSSKLL